MTVIDTYLNDVSAQQRKALERVRTLIRTHVPDAEECMSYGMPGFTYKGKYLAGFSAFKDHLSFFPTAEPIETLAHTLTSFKTSKGTVQFTLANPIPDDLLLKLIDVRVQSINARS
jgi:uncharacterized protein YdhG (YjbR/CyaY superfamily)